MSLMVGDYVKVVNKIDNYGCSGYIESIAEYGTYPIKVVFHEDTRDGDDNPHFNTWCCYYQNDIALVKRGDKT